MTLKYTPTTWTAPFITNLKSDDSMVIKQMMTSLTAEITRLQKLIEAIVDGDL